MKTYTLTDADRYTSRLVREARYGSGPVMITEHGQPAAAVISAEQLARFQALEDAADLRVIADIKGRGEDWVDGAEAQRMMAGWLDEADAQAATGADAAAERS